MSEDMENNDEKSSEGYSLFSNDIMVKNPSPSTTKNIPEKLTDENIERLNKLKKNFGKNLNLIVYTLLILIISISTFIRTKNLPLLKDVSNNEWTLGPDFDPFLFLRWAEYIVEHGKLFLLDSMRYVPLANICEGVNCNSVSTSKELLFFPYLIAWFHNILSMFSLTDSVTHSAVIFPVFIFSLSVIVFFFLTKKIFNNKFENKAFPNIIALVASTFLALTPVLLQKTISGIPEKESAGLLFIFLSFYFIIGALNEKNTKKIVIHSILSGLSTATLGLIWGGVTFVFMSIGIASFIIFIVGRIDKKKFLSLFLWVATYVPIMMFFSIRYNWEFFLIVIPNNIIFIVLAFCFLDIFIYPKIKNFKQIAKWEQKYDIPKEMISVILVVFVAFIIFFLFFGSDFIITQLDELYKDILSPVSSTRLLSSIKENVKPFFYNWKNNFGPLVMNIPLFFVMFIVGSLLLFHELVKKMDGKRKTIIIILFGMMLLGLVFSRYSESSIFNGENITSQLFYLGSLSLFGLYYLFILFKYNKSGKKYLLPKDFSYILLLVFFIVSILSARSATRFLLMIVPPASIFVGFLLVKSIQWAFPKPNVKKTYKIIIMLIIVGTILLTWYSFYEQLNKFSLELAPGKYEQQWQKAMSWVRDNTNEDAVFGSWWDYGYWIQSIGKRATILDGGNSINYWNHLMGRHVLTNPDPSDKTALEFLKTHKATHYLIDSTDIGKYSAYSSIGGDENNDRIGDVIVSKLGSVLKQEDNSILYLYKTRLFKLENDIIYKKDNGEQTFYKENYVISTIVMEEDPNGNLLQPEIVLAKGYFKNSKFTIEEDNAQIPIRYLYYKNNLKDFKSGIESTVFVFHKIDTLGDSATIDDKGGLLYLSENAGNSLFARKYLFNEEGSFNLMHSESAPIVKELESHGIETSEFIIYNNEFWGPIKIWEIEYPSNVIEDTKYLKTSFPSKKLEFLPTEA